MATEALDLTTLQRATTCRIVTRGRRTGREHITTVWFALVEATLYAPSRHGVNGDWLRNAVAADSVEIRQRQAAWTGVARVVVDHHELDSAVEALATKYARYGEITEAWHDDPPVVVGIRIDRRRA